MNTILLSLISMTTLLKCCQTFILGDFLPGHGQNGDPEPGPGSQRECNEFHEYHHLRQVLRNRPCISDTEIWSLLGELLEADRECLNFAVSQIAGESQSQDCVCTTSTFEKEVVPTFYDHSFSCVKYEPCLGLLGYFLELPQQHDQTKCQSHHHIWQKLKSAGYHDNIDYQQDIVSLLADAYADDASHDCRCRDRPAPTTKPPTTKPPTTTPTTTTSTTTAATTTKPHTMSTSCIKFNTVSDIVNVKQDVHPDAYTCQSTGTKTSSEAYVLVNCNVTAPNSWYKGVNVMQACSNGGTIPLYSPVATFNADHHSAVGFSGIFIGCLPTGIKIASQTCTSAPNIQHLDVGGSGNSDPNNYFVVVL